MEYCVKCGARFVGEQRFCSKCGAARSRPTVAPATGSAPAPAAVPAAAASAAFGTVSQVAGVSAAAAVGLPWQTIIAGQTPDLSAMLSRAAMPTAQAVVRRSLKRPGLSMAATTVLDLFVAAVSGGSGALAAALPRAIGGATTSLLSLVTGTKGGALRGLTGIVSLVTALVQVVSLLVTLVGGFLGGAPLLSLLPMAIATGSALVMALKTASVALRRRS